MGNKSSETQQQQQSQNQTTTQNPWGPQSDALQSIFSNAGTAFGAASGAPKPDQFVSQFTPDQLGVFQSMLNAGAGAGATGGALTGAGTNAATGGLFDLAKYAPTSMSSILGDANAAANDPSVQGRIDAALRDARRSVSEVGLPGIARNAALSGNTNSSRTGVREGILERGLADTTADTSANIRGDAYNTGLQTALTRAMTGDNNSLQAILGRVSGGNQTVGTGVDAAKGLFDIAQGGVAGQQAASNASIQDALQRYSFGTSSPFDALNNYFGIVGANNWGGTTNQTGTTNMTGTKTTEPSFFDTFGKLLSAGGSLLPYGKK